MAVAELGADGGRERELAGLGELVEGVAFAGVDVGHWDTGVRSRQGWGGGRLFDEGRLESFIQVTVQSAVLRLFVEGVLANRSVVEKYGHSPPSLNS